MHTLPTVREIIDDTVNVFDTFFVEEQKIYFPCKDSVKHIYYTESDVLSNKENIIKITNENKIFEMLQAFRAYSKAVILLPLEEYLESKPYPLFKL